MRMICSIKRLLILSYLNDVQTEPATIQKSTLGVCSTRYTTG